jgi:putative nucleotidyltransferase with HDIG domain
MHLQGDCRVTECVCSPSSEEAQSRPPTDPAAIERLFSRIGEISSMPQAALHIARLAGDYSTNAKELVDAIRKDPTLAMRIMRTVNSSCYALSAKVSNLNQATMLLGFEEIRNLALTSYVAAIFRKTDGYGSYTRRKLWDHLVATAMVSRLVAQVSGKAVAQDAYLAGLLHDVGLILIDQYDHRAFCRILDRLTADSPTWKVEQEMIGFDHAALGAFVAAKWGLSQRVTDAIRYHHKADQYPGEDRQFVAVVALANLFCHVKGIPSAGIRCVETLPAQVFSDLALQRQQVSAIMDQIDKTLKAADLMAVCQVR